MNFRARVLTPMHNATHAIRGAVLERLLVVGRARVEARRCAIREEERLQAGKRRNSAPPAAMAPPRRAPGK